jgi:hypothetical protein
MGMQSRPSERILEVWVVENEAARKLRVPVARRHTAHQRPSLIWYRTDVKLALGTKVEAQGGGLDRSGWEATKALTEHNAILGMLGVGPRNLKRHLRAMGHSRRNTNNSKIAEISRVLMRTAMRMYERYETYRMGEKPEASDGVT